VNKLLHVLLVTGVTLVALPCGRASAQGHVSGTLWSATEVLEGLQAVPLKCIPPTLLNRAEGVAIIPRVIKIGLALGGRFGEGVVLVRGPNGSWTNPIFISLTGGSIGWQAGIQSTDVVLVFKTRKSLDRLLEGKGKLTLGADAAVAAGPIGRQAEAGTDVKLQAEIYSYSRARGLFLGVSLEGTVIRNNVHANEDYTRRPRQEDVMAAEKLKAQLTIMCNPPPVIVRPPQPLLVPGSPPPPLAPPYIPPPPAPGRPPE